LRQKILGKKWLKAGRIKHSQVIALELTTPGDDKRIKGYCNRWIFQPMFFN